MMIEKWLLKHTRSLVGKTVAVSGSTGGIGRELCRYLSQGFLNGEVTLDYPDGSSEITGSLCKGGRRVRVRERNVTTEPEVGVI